MSGTSNLTKAQRATQRAIQRPRFMRDRHLKSITDIHSLAVQVEAGVVDKCELDVRIESFETIVSKFRLEQEAVVDVLLMNDCIEQFDEVDEPVSKSVEEMYFNVKHIVSRLSKKDSQRATIVAPTLSALPKIELPKFNGDILSWSLFRDTFLSAVHENPDISDIRRFQYLLMCVTGSALTIVKTFPLSASNYNLAWGALLNRFNNQRLLATAHVDKLFTFKPIAQESLPALNAFVNVFRENIAAIKQLGVNDLVGFILFHLASKALDSATRRSFELSLAPNQMPDFDLLLEFVQQRCKVLENIQGPVRAERAEKNVTTSKSHQTSKSFMSTTYDKSVNQKQFKCAFCNEAHTIYRCVAFQQITVEKRRDFVSTNKLCFSCLSTMHMINKCSSKSSCRICQKRHHTLLHLTTSTSNTTQVSDQANINVGDKSTPAPTSQVQFSGTSRTNSMVVLGTAVVRVKDSCGVLHSVRVLLDSGSQISAITNSCVSRIGLTKHKCYTEIVGLAQNPVAKIKGVTNCQFIPHHSTKNTFNCSDLFILPSITDVMPTLHLPPCIRKNYEHLLLADPNFDVPAPIDILLGGDVFPNIVRPRADIIHSSGYPSAFDTLLGWVVCGAISQSKPSPAVSMTAALTPSVDNLLRRFWTVEEPAVPVSPTTEDQLCEQMFVKTTYRAPCGRFCVALPFRPNAAELGESRALALKRFYNLERKLMKEPQLYIAYRKFMNDYQTLGHMEVARQTGKYFIPHHAVLKADGDISKLRVVFDASARSSSGLSLNDVLYTGPKLQTDIRDILLRIRLHRYIFTADIVKMYRQIMIRPEDRLFQHILWRNSPDEEIKEFELLTVTYGVSSAPYLAIRCLHELDAQEGHRFPLTKGILTDATYVDDIVVGADSQEQLLSLQKQIVPLLRSGGCELKKWTSNCPLILQQVPPEDCAQQTSFDPKEDHSIKVLGLYWDTDSDYFAYHTRTPEPQLSKRKVLSVIARLFDPIGALGPMLMWAKGFMQKLWHDQLDWDTPPENLSTAWNQFLTELPTIHQVTLPRYINVQSYSDIQLLGFADASLKGYAATIYLRVVHTSGNVSVHFVSCKTKVAPIKTSQLDESLSIPRLELCAALLLAQSLFHIQEVFSTSIKISQVRAWTDSTIVLSWLSSEQKYFKIFVTHRVVKIHALVPKCHWGHIRTHENPADPASRGLLPTTMASSSLHWNGPDFLTRPEEYWPTSTFTPMPLDDLPETKADTTTVLQVTKVHPFIEPFHRFSSLIKMQRVLAYCLRFSLRSRHRSVPAGPLTRAELNHVLIIAVKETQRVYFSDLWKQLTTSQMITPASLAQLAPFIDNDGLIRVGGRLRYSALTEDAKHPILLPHSAHVTKLLIRHYHLSFLHGGPKLILSMMSHKFWIISGRDAIRRFIFSCVTCSRHKADHPRPFMADLPSSRVQPHRPFLHVGMDYGGPFVIKDSRRRNARTSKAYLALFICMTVKAVHLEIVSDLTTDAFLAALDRFVARRGIPAHLYSDCGTNYVGAARQLKSIFRDTSVQEKMISHLPCTWHFNPPAAPHFGGLWEAAIKSSKYHMKHVIGTQILTFEEMLTLVTRIEGILNSRPLTPASSDPNDLVPLTPGHFLIGQPLHALPELDVSQVPLNRLNRWQLIRQCHQSFWKRWAKEYLTTLQGRQKWFHKELDLAVGDMVIVEAPSRPPSEWRLGRVTEVHPGKDETVRVVTVRTQDGTYKRPVVKLVKLPVNISSSWLLPQNEFPVFYRHFRDRVTWFEADAVCQFHHAQLATVESTSQFEAIRSYLKELDVIENVWIGLKRNSEASEFTWTNYQPLARSGYFREEVPRSSDPVCVVTDPTANFKWHSLHCGGPEVASFVCELPVPYWASKNNGCMTSMMEGMTVTFLPERPAIQLTKECSPGVSKNITCKGNMKQSEIIEKLSCPNSNKSLKTLFKPVKPEMVDIKLKTTTSSSESDVEDYAIEMATIAQYNDETFQSISKVMGRGSGGIINLPQEMSIAQEPIKSSGRGIFDTNGIDSAFIGGQVEATSTGASSISASTSTSTSTASPVSSTSTVNSASTTSTTSPTPKSEPKTSSTMTTKQTTTPTPIATATATTTHTGSVTYSTASGTTTHATTVTKATTSATKTGTTGRTVTTVGGQPTGTPTTTSNSHHNRQRGNSAYTTTANTNANVPIYATTTAFPRSRPTVQVTTTEKIHTVAKMLTAETGDVRRANVRRPTAATLAAIATVVAKIPYTVASTSATTTTSRPLNALRSYTNFGDGDVAATKDAPTTDPPIHVYKKIDFPGLPINDDGDYVRKPTATPFSSTSATTFSSPVTRNGNNRATTRYSTPLAMVASTTISASARPADALNNTYPAAAETATTNIVSDTSSPVASVTIDESDDDTNNWNLIPSSPSSLPAKTSNDADTTTMASASVTAAFDATSTATDAAAATVTAAITTTTRTTTTITPTESTSTVAATTTAAPANHRKIANYDAYTDHPNRSRHIVRPKQQHHHSYPYILYRLLG